MHEVPSPCPYEGSYSLLCLAGKRPSGMFKQRTKTSAKHADYLTMVTSTTPNYNTLLLYRSPTVVILIVMAYENTYNSARKVF